MPTIVELGQKVKEKYPGTYDSLTDAEVGKKVKDKYPDAYTMFSDTLPVPSTPKQAAALSTPLSAAPSSFSKTTLGQLPAAAASTAAQFGKNVLTSGKDLAGGMLNIVAHPVKTLETAAETASGLAQKVVPPSVQTPQTQKDQMQADALIGMLKQRYGSLDNVKNTIYNDPVGFAFDVSTLLEGGGGLAAKAGELSKVESVARAGEEVANAGKAVNPLNAASSVVSKVAEKIKTPLTGAAERMYQSALKPAGTAEEKSSVVKTGLKEKVWLTSGGVEKTADKIDELESHLGNIIDSAQAQGIKVETSSMKKYVEDVKNLFKYNVDVAEAQKASDTLDKMMKNFEKTYGKSLPIEEAQKIKVASGQGLKKMYGQMTSQPQVEGAKQMVRGLKDAIVEKAPVVGDINSRLKKLYEFDKALEKASGRAKNLNLLGMGLKIGAAAGGKAGAAVGLIADLLDKPGIKSGLAIGLNDLSELIGKNRSTGGVPLKEILGILTRSTPQGAQE